MPSFYSKLLLLYGGVVLVPADRKIYLSIVYLPVVCLLSTTMTAVAHDSMSDTCRIKPKPE